MFEGQRDEYSMEKRYVRKDGELVWVNINVSAYQESQPSTMYYVAVVHDINDKKNLSSN